MLTLKSWIHYLKNDPFKKNYGFLIFFFPVLLYLNFYFTFSGEYFNAVNLPNWNLMSSEMFAERYSHKQRKGKWSEKHFFNFKNIFFMFH